MALAIIVHGGAKTISEEKVAANNAGCLAAVEAGWVVLTSGGTAAEAVEAAIRVLEADQTFNASLGSTLNSDGEVELDAAVMEGASLGWGAVAAVQGVRHPIAVARKIMDEKPRLLVARGAERFAADIGAEMCKKEDLIASEQWQEWKEEQQVLDRPNTVGCVAMDASGTLAAGTSTGGTTNQQSGRVGDSAIVGSGLYADNKLGACSTTGDGESIIPVVLAKTAIDFLSGDRHPDEAAQMAIDVLKSRVTGEAGCILLDRQGRVGWAYNSQDMACAYMTTEMNTPAVFTKKESKQLLYV
ncbi:isoaspartyl peptidase/L-asparaginase family protein [Iningainema tapete]|uniref:Isoaspartyl peptidase/L-asparaginase n=1 Tax=Iningainema tapete BLCC-T55 TaxID=2748662 RepID=A0A8J6XK96_9CYAN|nr:isoaspartyl peptidase/L-asparaginase family protein [Iningainema tapete]MBD2778460.1 isoaspartyl peptidase/L-asparaginase [Iningainema tapete BLCC-T55]